MNLKPFEAGKPLLEQLTATRLNAIVAAVNAGEIMSGVGVRVSKTPGGTTISTCPTPRERRGITPEYIHPFKIFGYYESGQHRIRLQIGRVTIQRWVPNSTSAPKFSAEDLQVYYDANAGDLLGDDFPPTGSLGYIDLSAGTTYGVWMQLATSYAIRVDPTGTGQYPTIKEFYGSGASIVVSSTYTLFSQAAAYGLAASKAFYYLGKVVVNTDETMTIKQWRKSDICAGNDSLPTSIVVISADSPNSIVAGSDGGALYNDLNP